MLDRGPSGVDDRREGTEVFEVVLGGLFGVMRGLYQVIVCESRFVRRALVVAGSVGVLGGTMVSRGAFGVVGGLAVPLRWSV